MILLEIYLCVRSCVWFLQYVRCRPGDNLCQPKSSTLFVWLCTSDQIAQGSQGVLLFVHSISLCVHGSTHANAHAHIHYSFVWFLDIQTQVHTLMKQVFYPLSHFASQRFLKTTCNQRFPFWFLGSTIDWMVSIMQARQVLAPWDSPQPPIKSFYLHKSKWWTIISPQVFEFHPC